MKRLISTKGLHDGHFNAPWISTAIHERVDNKLTHCYKQDYGEDIVIAPTLSYELSEGVVMTLELAYTIDNPTPQRLENFREACENFYELYGFMVENENGTSRVLFRAIDIFDMASLIHALDYQSVSLEGVICAVDDGLTEKDAIYSPSGSYLIQIPNIPHYRIKEGTLYISPMAARHCTELQKLDIPVEMLFDNGSLREYPQGLKVKIWGRRLTAVSSIADNTSPTLAADCYSQGSTVIESVRNGKLRLRRDSHNAQGEGEGKESASHRISRRCACS